MEGKLKRKGIYVYVELTHFVVQQKLAQHRKATHTSIIKQICIFPINISFIVKGYTFSIPVNITCFLETKKKYIYICDLLYCIISLIVVT